MSQLKKQTRKPVQRRRADYSQRWLADYGQHLKHHEIQLVQAYRGLPREKQAALLRLLADLIISDARAVTWTRAGARARLVADALDGAR